MSVPNEGTNITRRGGEARPAARDAGRVAVVDIGSNSIRLVVFDGLKRAFLPLFNEKVICGLGRGLRTTGRLSEDGMHAALVNLARFAAMARAMEVSEMTMVATAAAREAENGAAFVAEVERLCGHHVQVLTGAEEARLAALGVLAGFPDADGIMGDLGGGSLELVALDGGCLGMSETLGLGPLRLMEIAKDRPRRALDEIDRQLDRLDWLGAIEGRSFYAVGGAWRDLGRLHMDQGDYPLHVLHGYSMTRAEAMELARLVGRLGSRSLARLPSIARRRAEALPYGALLLERLLRRCRPARLVFSAHGLREGLLFDRLPAARRARDPLLDAAAELAAEEGRFGGLGEVLTQWTDPLFPGEEPARRRLRLAACHLSDQAWRESPDYRADHALRRVLHYPFMAIDHPARAFVAAVVFTRYAGTATLPDAEPALTLLSEPAAEQATVLGLALRLAYTLCAGVPALLDKVSLALENGRLRLTLPVDGSIPSGETVERRLEQLADAAGAEHSEIVQ